MEFRHVKVVKETGEIVEYYVEGIPVPELDENDFLAIYPLTSDDMIDNAIIRGQVYNAETGKIEDTVLSINIKCEDKLKQSDWMILRHIEQRTLGHKTSISESEFMDLLVWRQSLRDVIE